MINALLFVFLFNSVNLPDLVHIRQLYYAAYENKSSADRFLHYMTRLNDNSDPVYVAYTGVSHLMQARFSVNPYASIKNFYTGKRILNKAVAMDPGHMEIRFLRFCIQTSAPSFLGYYDDIESDKAMVLKGWRNSRDADLKARVKKFMMKSRYCNENERRIF